MHRLWPSAGIMIICLLAAAPAPARAQSGAEIGQLNLRIQALEERNRQLTGQVEQLGHQVRQLQDLARRQQEDIEYRLQQLEGGKPGLRPSSSSSSSDAPQATPPRAPATRTTAPAAAPSAAPVPGAGSAAVGQPPQVLGQVPGNPLDLSAVTQAGQAIEEQGRELSGRLAAAPSGSPKDAYDLSYGYILRADYASAAAGFSDFLARFPQDPLAGNAQYWLGEAHFAQGQYRNAADSFLKAYSQYPGSAKAPDALLKLGMSLNQMQQTDAACSAFREVGNKFPNASRTVRETARAEMSRAGC